MLGREDILGAVDLETEKVSVPEWGGEVLVTGLDGTSRDAYEASLWRQTGDTAADGQVDVSNRRAKLVALGCRGKDGEPLFTLEDAEALGRKSGKALERVAGVVRRLSGMEDDAKEVAEGN